MRKYPGTGWSRGTPRQIFSHWGSVFVIFWYRNWAQAYSFERAVQNPDRTGSDLQKTDRINNKIPAKNRRSPDNVLKTGKVEFCAFLSWVVVSSFIETRRNVFFSRGDYRSEAEFWKIRCDELTACATVLKTENNFLLYPSPWQLHKSSQFAYWRQFVTSYLSYNSASESVITFGKTKNISTSLNKWGDDYTREKGTEFEHVVLCSWSGPSFANPVRSDPIWSSPARSDPVWSWFCQRAFERHFLNK